MRPEDINAESRYGEKSQMYEDSIESHMVTKMKMFCAISDTQLSKFGKLRDDLCDNDA